MRPRDSWSSLFIAQLYDTLCVASSVNCHVEALFASSVMSQSATLLLMWTLTYMSIRDEIKRLEHDGKLFCLESGLMGEETPRTLWMSQEVRDAVILPPRVKADRRLFEFRQFLDSWLEYSRFSVAE